MASERCAKCGAESLPEIGIPHRLGCPNTDAPAPREAGAILSNGDGGQFNAPDYMAEIAALRAENERLTRERDETQERLDAAEGEGDTLEADNVRLAEALAEARRVWNQVTVTPSGAARVAGLAALRDEVSACRADNLRLAVENARLCEALRIAREDLAEWIGYAPKWATLKWDAPAALARIDAALKRGEKP